MLAEFIGFVESEEKDYYYYPANWDLDPIHDDDFEPDLHIENMKFRHSYDWLMKALDKIYQPYTLSISYDKTSDVFKTVIRILDDDGMMKSFSSMTNDKIDGLYNVIIDVVKTFRL